MDTFQWPQAFGILTNFESTRPILENYKKSTMRSQEDQQAAPLNCPRCKSNNTKFCYYNNYSISQPRYLCKSCKRYWTEGGHVRDVRVGGGARKHKRPSSSSSTTSSTTTTTTTTTTSSKKVVSVNLNPPKTSPAQNPRIQSQQTMMSFDFNRSNDYGMSGFEPLLSFECNFKNNLNIQNPSFCTASSSSSHPPVDSVVSMPVSNSDSVFSSSSFDDYMHDFESGPDFSSLNELGKVYGNNFQGVQENTATSSRMVFPFEDMGHVSTSDHHHHHQYEQHSDPNNGCWNGVMMDDSLW